MNNRFTCKRYIIGLSKKMGGKLQTKKRIFILLSGVIKELKLWTELDLLNSEFEISWNWVN